jgi:hypothetical protein
MLRLEAIVRVVDEQGAVVAEVPAIAGLVHLPGAPLEGAFLYWTGKRLAEVLPLAGGQELVAPAEVAGKNGALPVGSVYRITAPGALQGRRVRNRGLLDIGWRPVPNYYSMDILDGPDAGSTVGVMPAQCELVEA